MKFRIFSDIHNDINEFNMYNILGDKSIFNLIAGDIAGISKFRDEWLNKHIKNGYKGVFVEGNHILYGNSKQTLDEIQDELHDKYPLDKDSFSFMENDCMLLEENGEKVLIIGCTLWTDFNYGNGTQDIKGFFAERGMNDYHMKAIKTLPDEEYKGAAKNRWNDGVRNMCWQDTAEFHKKSVEYIINTIKEYNDKCDKIVILTHHSPCGQSLAPEYVNSSLNAAYVSEDMIDIILDNPKIKLFVHGHIHSNSDYYIGDCRVVCNPYGYTHVYENCYFKPDLIIEI